MASRSMSARSSATTHAWDRALASAAAVFRECGERGINLSMVNLGGGFPTKYLKNVPAVKTYGSAIFRALRKHFGNRIPETIIEPGRGMVGNAGVIEAEVVLVSKKSEDDDVRWVYLDIGKFGGLAETMDESIRYPIRTPRDGDALAPCVLAGPTCDSADVLYEKQPYLLPVSLEIGDKVLIEGTGAYTATYSSVAFNGFPPLKTYPHLSIAGSRPRADSRAGSPSLQSIRTDGAVARHGAGRSMAMITIRHENADRRHRRRARRCSTGLRRCRFAKTSERLREGPPAGGRPVVRRGRRRPHRRHRAAVERRGRPRPRGAAARAARGRSGDCRSRGIGGRLMRQRCRKPRAARPWRGPAGRRRALLRPLRLLGREDRRACGCRARSSATGCWRSNSCRARSTARAG